MRVGSCLHEIEHDIHVSWGREPHPDPIRARIAEVDSRISFQHLAALSNNRPGEPDLDEICVFKMGDLLAVHPIGEIILEHGRTLYHPIESGDRVSEGIDHGYQSRSHCRTRVLSIAGYETRHEARRGVSSLTTARTLQALPFDLPGSPTPWKREPPVSPKQNRQEQKRGPGGQEGRQG